MLGVLLILLAVLLLLVLAGVVYQAAGTARDARKFSPLGRMVGVGGRRLHIHCTGKGSPTVVLDAGLPGSCLSWTFVQPEVAKFTRVCSYDRAGLGWSDPGPEPRTAQRIVEELHQLLTNAGIQGPYVLVGHSFGGLTVRLYAATYPDEVAAMVLVDPLPPSEWLHLTERQTRNIAAGVRMARRAALGARLGLLRLYLSLVSSGMIKAKAQGDWVGSFKKLPAELLPVVRAFWSQPKPYQALADQVAALAESAVQVAAAGAYGEVPVVILSASNTSLARRTEQEATARLSTNGKHLVAAKSGHWVQLDQPELVIEAIQEVVESARRRKATIAQQLQP